MPYTKQELENVDFYNEFVEKLRNNYKDEMKKVVLPSSTSSGWTNSRKDGVLYSFEHYLTGLGIEEVFVAPNAFHDFMYVANEYDAREGQYSKTEELYPLYNHGELLDKVIDREISELVTPPPTGGSLPDGIKNGDRVAIESDFEGGELGHPLDIWFIEDDKKRKYQDKFAFFSSGFSKSTIKLRSKSDIDSIVDGEDITIGWRGWPTDKGSEGVF
jgi:hypothetical protein